MNLLRHSIYINNNIENIFKICLDVENWPTYFPPCLKATVLKQDTENQLIEITAYANNKTMTWQSHRLIDRASHTIFFQQVRPSVLLKKMKGAWRLYELNGGVLVSLEHQFEVKDDVSGLVDGIKNRDEATNYMEKIIHVNSQQELQALKKSIELPTEMDCSQSVNFQESLTVPAPIEKCFLALQDIRKWPLLLPHCEDMTVLYDDGVNQEFIMKVIVQDHSESIRSIRYCQKYDKISYFQPNPPPVLTKHEGKWLFQAKENGTLITSWHDIGLHSENVKRLWGDVSTNQALLRIKSAINNNSLQTMQAIAELIPASVSMEE